METTITSPYLREDSLEELLKQPVSLLLSSHGSVQVVKFKLHHGRSDLVTLGKGAQNRLELAPHWLRRELHHLHIGEVNSSV